MSTANSVIVVIGAGQIGQAIARRVSVGKRVILADRSETNARAAADVLGNAGYETTAVTVDVSSRETVRALVEQATKLGYVTGLIHAAGVSPGQAPKEAVLHVDLYGTAVAYGGAPEAPFSPVRSDQGFARRVPGLEARELLAGDG